MRKRFLLGIIFTVIFISGAQAATLHGTIYDWSDFEKPLKGAIVEVNSTPSQYVISTNGTYSFNLSSGNYLIKAKYYNNNILEFTAEDEIRIDREGDYVHDLLLFPPTELDKQYLGDINLTGDLVTKSDSNQIYYIITIFLVFAALFILYWIRKKKNKPVEKSPGETIEIPPEISPEIPPENIAKTESIELPEDLREIYGLLLKKGGRVTQKDLRKEVKYGEAKVSLMIADLENRGLVKKIKRGRANIIIAEDKK
ncbi:MAG: hypothetical protein O8C64_06255 [Candidatus Methanoperedens sp.]|nr:hypothetical protein [Candidatus Methanoperedens sp.]MCZ7404435.1 hypothetical protein [Candidatus Methanoperedens sp.]